MLEDVIQERIPSGFCTVLAQKSDDVIVNSTEGFDYHQGELTFESKVSTERQRAEYLATFFAARLLAAAPALVEDEGEPLMASMAHPQHQFDAGPRARVSNRAIKEMVATRGDGIGDDCISRLSRFRGEVPTEIMAMRGDQLKGSEDVH